MDGAVAIYIVAFDADVSALRTTLERCAAQHDLPLTVLGSDSTALAEVAREAGCVLLDVLPGTCDPAKYWSVVLRALAGRSEAGLVVRAGTGLPPYWHRRLGPQPPDVAAVFPLSVRHPCTAVFEHTSHEPGLAVDEIDRWLNAYVPGVAFDIPVFAGQTALVNPLKFPAEAGLDDEALAAVVRESGGLILATDNLFVDDRQLEPYSLPATIHQAWEQAIERRHPLTAVRHALTELSARREVPAPHIPPLRPALLHISHSWGGGLGRWVEDFTSADDGYLNYILRSIGDWSGFGQALALYSSADLERPLQTWTLIEPILSTSTAHFQYRELLDEIIAQFHIEAILVSSLIGHSLDALKSDVPTAVVVHDFYPFCPPLMATWDTPCTQCDAARLADCLQKNPAHRFFLHEGEAHWQALRQAFLNEVVQRSLATVVPSKSVAQRLHGLAPVLGDRSMQVIAHGLPAKLIASLSGIDPGPAHGRRLRIVVLGSLESHKGAALLLAAVERLSAFSDFIFLGCGDSGDKLGKIPGAQVVKAYRRDELGQLLARYQPDLGLLLSVVPETFSFTLSELNAAAIPTVATNLGAFADRISHGDSGWLVEPDSNLLVAQVEALAAQPEQIAVVRARLMESRQRDAVQMVGDYHALFPPVSSYLGRPLRHVAQLMSDNKDLRILPGAGFGQVFREFLAYTVSKFENTERLPGYFKRAILAIIRLFRRWQK